MSILLNVSLSVFLFAGVIGLLYLKQALRSYIA